MTILERGCAAIARALREFGYPGVTADQIATAHRAWLRGEPQSDVIAKFAEREFEDKPEIFGRPESSIERL